MGSATLRITILEDIIPNDFKGDCTRIICIFLTSFIFSCTCLGSKKNQSVMVKNLDAMHLGFSPFQTGLYQVTYKADI